MFEQEWHKQAACRDADVDALFTKGKEQNVSKRICDGCPVKMECLAEALDHQIEFGVWGGKTERERRAILKRRPDVQSWQRLLEEAKATHTIRYAAAEAVAEEERRVALAKALANFPRQHADNSGSLLMKCAGCRKEFTAETMNRRKIQYADKSRSTVMGVWHYPCWAKQRDALAAATAEGEGLVPA